MTTIDMSKIGLKPREMQTLRPARWALDMVPNGHYLTSPGQKRAAERLIERGFLTKAPGQFTPPRPDWLVVKLTKENMVALETAARADAASSAAPAKEP